MRRNRRSSSVDRKDISVMVSLISYKESLVALSHFLSACPNGGTGGAPKPKSYGGGGGGGSSNMSCFKCGEEGHFSNGML